MSNYAPWYVIAWRCPWVVLAYTLMGLLVAVITCGWGLRTAQRAWRSMA